MIFQYCFQDVVGENKLTELKYSVLCACSLKSHYPHLKVHVSYGRRMMRWPFCDLAALYSGKLVDEITRRNLTPQETRSINVYYHAEYLERAKVNPTEPVIFLMSNIVPFGVPDKMDQNAIYFWNSDCAWREVVWGVVNITDIQDLFAYCRENNLANNVPERYSMFNGDVFYVPKTYIQEFREKVPKIVTFLMKKYENSMQNFVVCPCASQIATSIVAQDIEDRDGVEIKWAISEFPMTKNIAESETDVAGNLRLLF